MMCLVIGILAPLTQGHTGHTLDPKVPLYLPGKPHSPSSQTRSWTQPEIISHGVQKGTFPDGGTWVKGPGCWHWAGS